MKGERVKGRMELCLHNGGLIGKAHVADPPNNVEEWEIRKATAERYASAFKNRRGRRGLPAEFKYQARLSQAWLADESDDLSSLGWTPGVALVAGLRSRDRVRQMERAPARR